MSQQNVVRKRIRKLREEIQNLIDYLDLLNACALNFGKKRYSTEQVKKMLNLRSAELEL
jgi:hypothetical protein